MPSCPCLPSSHCVAGRQPPARQHTSCINRPVFGTAVQADCSSALRYRQSKRALRTQAAANSAPVVERLSGDKLQQWQECQQQVMRLGLAEEDSDTVLSKAFGWKSQLYWRDSKVEELPMPQQVTDVLGWLQQLGLTEAEVAAVVEKFPEVLGCGVEERLQPNIDTLGNKWGLKGKNAAAAVRRHPQLLGYVVDCEGDCLGQCNRCWVRF